VEVIFRKVAAGTEENKENRARVGGVSNRAPPKYKPKALPLQQPLRHCSINLEHVYEIVYRGVLYVF
jgi:hypothetical protein